MRSAIRPVFTSTSRQGMRPPSVVGTRRWQMIPRSAPASVNLTWFCCSPGKKSTTRFTVSVASSV